MNGVEPQYAQIRTIPIGQGRFLIDGDETEARRVCVLGDNVRKQLFAERPNVLGAEMRHQRPAVPDRGADAEQEPEQQL